MSRYIELETSYHRYSALEVRNLPVADLLAEMRGYVVPLFPNATDRTEEELSRLIALIQSYLDRVAYIRTQSLAMRDIWKELREDVENYVQERIDFLLATRPDIRNMSPDSVRRAAARREVAAEMKTLLQNVQRREAHMSTFDRQVQLRMERLQGTYEALSRQVSIIELQRRREFFSRMPDQQGLVKP